MSTPSIPVFTTLPPLRTLRRQATLSTTTIALIPTMGALHAGHLSLITSAAQTHTHLIVSIFVNPAQFAPHEDLSTYPRPFSSDLEQLNKLNESLATSFPPVPGRIVGVFHPPPELLYPRGIPLDQEKQQGAFVTITPISSRLEGVSRPHFFRGVATICTKLFNIVQPDAAYFGQKDIQQTVVLKQLVDDLLFPIQIVVCPTLRDPLDGLACSSRNVYLGIIRRGYANCLYDALMTAKSVYEDGIKEGNDGRTAGEILGSAKKALEKVVKTRWVEVEYLCLAEGKGLEEFAEADKVGDGDRGAVLSGAVRILPRGEQEGVVRLIDNIIL